MKKINSGIISEVIPEGVGEEFFKIKKSEAKHILFLGRFDVSQKGIDLLLESYSKIVKKIRYPLVIAGRGADEIKIRYLIRKYKLENKVTIVGPAFGRKKVKLLASSLFVTLPSRHEGFSLFALEAMAAGLPLVIFDIPGMSWITNGSALKAKPFDTNLYGELLLTASDKQLNEKMSKESRNYAHRYTWGNVAERYESFFYNILN